MTHKLQPASKNVQKLTDQEQHFLGLVKSSMMKNYLDQGANLCQENLLALFSLARIALREETDSPSTFTLEKFSLPENRGLTLSQLRSKQPDTTQRPRSSARSSKQYPSE